MDLTDDEELVLGRCLGGRAWSLRVSIFCAAMILLACVLLVLGHRWTDDVRVCVIVVGMLVLTWVNERKRRRDAALLRTYQAALLISPPPSVEQFLAGLTATEHLTLNSCLAARPESKAWWNLPLLAGFGLCVVLLATVPVLHSWLYGLAFILGIALMGVSMEAKRRLVLASVVQKHHAALRAAAVAGPPQQSPAPA
jgi:Flp pilus assembly protein TadB